MLTLIAVLLTMVGSVLVYVSNKNQRLLRQQQPLLWRYCGYLLIAVALAVWMVAISFISALFIWFLTTSLVISLIPFVALIQPGKDA